MTFRTKVNYRKGVFRFLGSNIYLVIGTGLLFGVWRFGICCLLFVGIFNLALLAPLRALRETKPQTTNNKLFPSEAN
jgi:hypothetical protein